MITLHQYSEVYHYIIVFTHKRLNQIPSYFDHFPLFYSHTVHLFIVGASCGGEALQPKGWGPFWCLDGHRIPKRKKGVRDRTCEDGKMEAYGWVEKTEVKRTVCTFSEIRTKRVKDANFLNICTSQFFSHSTFDLIKLPDVCLYFLISL